MTAHPLNAEGDFYVEHGCCTACDVPMRSAPSLFAYDETSHCFVKRQPSTQTECDMMFEAIRGAELRCIRYRGRDNDWYRRLVSSGDFDVCDYPPNEPVEPRIRSIVECDTKYESLDALADAFEQYLKSTEMEHFYFDFKRSESSDSLLHFHRCSVYSVVQKNGIATNLAVGIGTTGRGTFAPPEIQPEIQSVGKHQKHAP